MAINIKNGVNRMNNVGILMRIWINVFIVIFLVVTFSERFVGVQISFDRPLQSAFGIMAILISVSMFWRVNFSLRRKKGDSEQSEEDKHVDTTSIKDAFFSDFTKDCMESSIFEKSIVKIRRQSQSFDRKKITIERLLSEKFDVNEMTYRKFNGVVLDAFEVFETNRDSALSKIRAFEDAGAAVSEKEVILEYQEFITSAIKANDEIVLKLDKLILEISKLNNKMHGDIENLDEIKELDALIKNIKLYS